MAGTVHTPAVLTNHLPLIEDALRKYVGLRSDPLDAAARYTLGWETADGSPTETGGKRIRPALCLLAAECCGAEPASALAGAVAVELVHNFSLVHDDIQDRDLERHGRATLWSRLGEPQAINAGDFLFTIALRALAADDSIEAGRRTRTLTVLSDAVADMIRGQWLDITFESDLTVSVEEYNTMVTGKTGALLGASLEIGATLAGAPAETSRGFAQWGRAIGLAFQAHDDYLGVWGDSLVTGKSVTSDIARRKRSLPIVLALADEPASRVIREEYAREHGPHVETVMQALASCGAREGAQEIEQQHLGMARELLDQLDIAGEHRRNLAAVADYVVTRER